MVHRPIKHGFWQAFFVGIGASSCWAGLILTFALFQIKAPELGLGVIGAALKFFTYMTHLTVFGIALVFTGALCMPGALKKWSEKRSAPLSALFVYAILIFGVYQFMLSGSWHPQGLWKVANTLLHYVAPSMYACFWFFMVGHGALGWKHVFSWQLFPIGYALIVLIIGGATGEYPYPILEVEQLGWPVVLANMGMVLAGYVIISAVIVGTDKLLCGRDVSTAR